MYVRIVMVLSVNLLPNTPSTRWGAVDDFFSLKNTTDFGNKTIWF